MSNTVIANYYMYMACIVCVLYMHACGCNFAYYHVCRRNVRFT